MRKLLLATALLLAGTTSAFAGPNGSSFTLVDPARTPQRAIVLDGVSWRCGNNVCTSTSGPAQAAPRACRRVAARVGVALASFTYKGVTLTADELAVCNTSAA